MSRRTDPTLPIDHVAFGSNDLEAAQDALAGLGLSHTPVAEARWPRPDGPHRARTLSVMLADGYLDVIELPAAASALEPTGVVLRADDLAGAHSRLTEAGVRCGRPYTIVRRFEGVGPDQHYEIFGIDSRHPSGLPMSVIETQAGEPMRNRAPHSADVARLSEAARLLDVDLDASPERSPAK